MKRVLEIRPMVQLALIAAFHCLCHDLTAIEVGWHQQINFQCGDGVTLNPSQVKSYPGLVIMGNQVLLDTGYQDEIVTFAQNTSDMISKLYANASASLNALIFHGDVDVSFFGEEGFDGKTLKVVFTKTRNFGTTLCTPLGFSTNFWNQVNRYKTQFQGEALHAKITGTFGTHYVRGYQSAAIVSVVYTFTNVTEAAKARLTASASGGVLDFASFSAFVNAFLGTTNSATSVGYDFYSSDTTTNFNFGSRSITNYQQFTNFITKAEGYANTLSATNAIPVEYVLDPIQTVPGYVSLLGGYVPPPMDPSDSDEFLQDYTALEVWQGRLLNWISAMDWLNSQGQQVLQSKYDDVGRYLTAMKDIASSHFIAGTPLYVPADIIAYLATVSDLKIPEIYVMDCFDYPQYTTSCACNVTYHCLIGRLDCGCRDLVGPSPFFSITGLYYNTNKPYAATIGNGGIHYTAADFENAETNVFKSGAVYDHLLNLVTNEQWACLTNSAVDPDLEGFFVFTNRHDTSSGGQAAAWSLVVSNAAGTLLVDKLPFLSTRSGGCGAPCLISNVVSVSIPSISPTSTGVVGLAQTVTVRVTNNSPVQAYGTMVSVALSNAFDFLDASGTQGSASFDTNSRVVSYVVGPMLGGASADIQFRLVPLRPGIAVAGSLPPPSLGSPLTNAGPTNAVSFSPVQASLPVLGLTRTPFGLQLDWWSDTDRLQPEGGPSLLGPWSTVASGTVTDGNHHFATPSVSGPQGYVRLHLQ